MTKLDDVLDRNVGKVPPRAQLEAEALKLALWQLEASLLRLRISRALESYGPKREASVHRWIIPHFGNDDLCDITRAAILAFFDELDGKNSRFGGRRLTQQFMKNVHTILHKIFDDAIDRNFAANNPAHKIKIEGGRDSVERVMPDPGDVQKTFAKLDTAYQVLLLTFAFTGLRRGELLGLRWQDVELEVGVPPCAQASPTRQEKSAEREHIPERGADRKHGPGAGNAEVEAVRAIH